MSRTKPVTWAKVMAGTAVLALSLAACSGDDSSTPPQAEDTDRSVESPESLMLWQAFAPLTPPAALMSETARPTPEISGGPR